MFSTPLQQTVYYNTYSRWNAELGRRENWDETVARVVKYLNKTVIGHCSKNNITKIDIDWHGIEQGIKNLEVMPSMRLIQMAGPAIDRCNVGSFNCAYLPLQDFHSLAELLYILMQGTGCGFSVERQYTDQFPFIKVQLDSPKATYVIEDSTEGWCNAFEYGMLTWAVGKDVEFDYSRLRPYGAALETKGGKSSGAGPLKDLLDYTRKMFLNHQGRKLSSLNMHDLACYCGSIVQIGGVRRAAEISLSDLDDIKLRHVKDGQFWTVAPERAMANNSAVYSTKPDMQTFMQEWTALMQSGSGERGIFNRGDINKQIPERRDKHESFGLNPCGEVILRPYQFCNLSVCVARASDTMVDLRRKIELAAQIGVIQSLLTDFKYIRPEWKKNCEEERLLGVDITGQLDNKIFSGLGAWQAFQDLKFTAIHSAFRLADQLKINRPAAVTCVKPSGNSSQLLDCASGLHPRFAKFYIRRVRVGATTPLVPILKDAGVPCFPDIGQQPDNPSIWVFEFPVKPPEGAVTRDKWDVMRQLEYWKTCKREYTEHNPSCTIYVKDDEWMKVGAWVYDNWKDIGGLSFLPYSGGNYQLAPYEECTEEEYNSRMAAIGELKWENLRLYEQVDRTEVNRDYACSGDKCEL